MQIVCDSSEVTRSMVRERFNLNKNDLLRCQGETIASLAMWMIHITKYCMLPHKTLWLSYVDMSSFVREVLCWRKILVNNFCQDEIIPRKEMWLPEINKLLRITELVWDRQWPTKSSKEKLLVAKWLSKGNRSCNLREPIEDYNELGRITRKLIVWKKYK